MRLTLGRCALVVCGAFVMSCDDAGASSTDRGPTIFPEEMVDAGTGARFSDLYRDFFGPTGAASCAGDGACHGSSTQKGAIASGGYVCADEAGCWDAMTTVLVGPSPASAEDTRLYRVLRRRRDDGSTAGTMPLRPGYVFSRASMLRVKMWIESGAKKD